VRRLLLTSTALLTGLALSGAARAADPAPGGEDKRPNAALAACASGDVTKGIAILGELYAETRNPSYVFNQGRCFQKNNKLEQARGSFEIARFYEKKRRWDGALIYYNEVLIKDPNSKYATEARERIDTLKKRAKK